jgi:hypothetical protein
MIGGPGSVAKRLISVNGNMLIGAVEGGFEEDVAVLEEGVVDVETGPGQGVEGVEVDGGDDGEDNAGKGVSKDETERKGRQLQHTGSKRTLW